MCLLGTIVISELQLEIAMSLFMKMSLELNNLLLHHVSSHITLQPSNDQNQVSILTCIKSLSLFALNLISAPDQILLQTNSTNLYYEYRKLNHTGIQCLYDLNTVPR